MSEPQSPKRTPAARKARQLAKYLRAERPDYAYLKQVFRHLREELGVEVQRAPKKLPHVPTEHEIRSFYEAVWHGRRSQDVVMIIRGAMIGPECSRRAAHQDSIRNNLLQLRR